MIPGQKALGDPLIELAGPALDRGAPRPPRTAVSRSWTRLPLPTISTPPSRSGARAAPSPTWRAGAARSRLSCTTGTSASGSATRNGAQATVVEPAPLVDGRVEACPRQQPGHFPGQLGVARGRVAQLVQLLGEAEEVVHRLRAWQRPVSRAWGARQCAETSSSARQAGHWRPHSARERAKALRPRAFMGLPWEAKEDRQAPGGGCAHAGRLSPQSGRRGSKPALPRPFVKNYLNSLTQARLGLDSRLWVESSRQLGSLERRSAWQTLVRPARRPRALDGLAPPFLPRRPRAGPRTRGSTFFVPGSRPSPLHASFHSAPGGRRLRAIGRPPAFRARGAWQA